MPCNPDEPNDNVTRYTGSLISASSGNRYTSVQAVLSSAYVPFLEAGSRSEEWIGLYEPAGQLGKVRFGFRYTPGTTAVFVEYTDQNGNVFAETGATPVGPHEFRIKFSDDALPGAEIDVFLDDVPFDEHDMQFTPTRALLNCNTSNRGNEILGSIGSKNRWSEAGYKRNFGALIDWPANAAQVNGFGGARASIVVAEGLQTVYDKSATC